MKRTIVPLVFALLLLAMPATAENGEVMTATPNDYPPQNDIPAWMLGQRSLTAEAIAQARGGTFFAELLPIDEDTLLFYGTFQYHDLRREEWHTTEYDGDIPRQDAYAVAINQQGERKWSLGLSDPHAQNSFANAWLLPDGRILLWHYNAYGEWGSQYYIVSSWGEVQEMLPAYKAEAYETSGTLRPMHGGYFGGGTHLFDGALGPMVDRANFTFFDESLNMRWQNQSEIYLPGSFQEVYEVSDGFLIVGTRMQGYERSGMMPNNPVFYAPMVSKIGLDGETRWSYTGHEYAGTGAYSAAPTAEGGALFITHYDPTTATPFDAKDVGTLVKLDGEGALAWVKQYEEDAHPFLYFTDLVPYQEGFVLSGMLAGEERSWALLYIDSEGTPLKRINLALEEADYADVSLVAAGGEVYAYGNVATYESEMADMNQKPDCRPFYLNVEEVLP